MEIEGGKLVTWGSADDENQSYVTCGKHGVMIFYFSFFFWKFAEINI